MKAGFLPLAAGLAIALAGCGKSEQAQLAEYNTAFVNACQTQASQHGIPANIAQPACDCALAEFDKKYPGAAKITKPLSEAATFVQECARKVAAGG